MVVHLHNAVEHVIRLLEDIAAEHLRNLRLAMLISKRLQVGGFLAVLGTNLERPGVLLLILQEGFDESRIVSVARRVTDPVRLSQELGY